jgi:transposase
MVHRIEVQGWTARAVAAAFAVSERTVRKWLARYRAVGPIGLADRSSRARVVANKLTGLWVAMALRRRQYRLRGAEIADRLHLAQTTVAGHLAATRRGQLQALKPQPPVVRYPGYPLPA